MEKKSSIFSALNPAPPPSQFQRPSEPSPSPQYPREESDSRIAGLEASVRALQDEIAALKQAVSRPPPPPPPPPPPRKEGPDPELVSRLERSETGMSDLRAGLESCMDQTKNIEERVSKSGADIASRLERSEAGMTGLKAGLESCRTLAKRLEAYIERNDIENVNLNVSETVDEFKAMKRKLDGYSEEFSNIEQECRKAVGEMRGHVKNVSQKLVADRFDDHLKESLSRLSPKIAELEKTMHAGLADLSSRLMSDEVLYGKILAEAESNVRKGLEPDIAELKGRLKGIDEKIAWLADEQNIVLERRLRALEAKASAFGAIAARMDSLESESVKGGGGKE